MERIDWEELPKRGRVPCFNDDVILALESHLQGNQHLSIGFVELVV